MITMDGKKYNVNVMELKRSFTVLDTDKSGRPLNGNMIRDIVGTYYNYNLQIEMKNYDVKEYSSFYQAISSPTEKHTVTFPYNNETLTFKAYITKGEDNYKLINGVPVWSGLSVDFVAMEPYRRP